MAMDMWTYTLAPGIFQSQQIMPRLDDIKAEKSRGRPFVESHWQPRYFLD
jgi:hypothetical protein